MRAFAAALVAALWLTAAASAQEPKYQIAVSPFANAGADKSADFIGFQASEFISNAMAGFPGVQVIERGQLMRILEEQELQLSGITEGAKGASVGQILNARQIVVGSFELGASKLLLNARIVDVSSGALLSRAQVEAPRADSYAPAYKALLYRLISGLPEYKMTIGVEARIENISEQAESPAAQASDDYAKALAALYNKDDSAALEYLQKAMGSGDVGFVGFGDAAARYVEALARVRGSSRYAKMVQRQVETNKALMEQVEPLSLYRATLKILKARAEALLVPEAFAIRGNPADAVDFRDGAVSTRVILPAEIEIGLKPEARAALETLFAGQDVARLGASGISLSPLPAGKLFGPETLRGLFDFRILASIPHALQFLDAKGGVMYELRSDPAAALGLAAGRAAYSGKVRPTYVPAAYRDGWALREDGSLEIQARALADLDTVRYAILSEGVELRAAFGLDSDIVWRSLVSHAYRKRSIKVASQVEDPAPQFKEVVIADSFYDPADPELGRVPILPRNGRVAGFTALTAVVYFADSAKDAVNVSWSGAVAGASKPFVGEIGPNTVLYFDAPDEYGLRYGEVSVTARLGQAPAGKTAIATLGNGAGWSSEDSASGFVLAGERLFTTRGTAFSLEGATRGPAFEGCMALIDGGDAIYAIDGKAIRRLDKKSGALLGEAAIAQRDRIYRASIEAGKLYIQSSRGLEALDPRAGTQLWRASDAAGREGFLVARGRVYSSSGQVLDASTGARLFSSEGQGALAAAEGKLYWANGVCADMESGKTIWKVRGDRESIGSPIPSGETVFFGGKMALAAKDGAVVWSRDSGPSQALLEGGRLYAWDDDTLLALDPATGKAFWKTATGSARAALVAAGESIYASLDEGGLSRLDLRLFERELGAAESERRGRLGAPLGTSSANRKSCAQVFGLEAGGGAEAAGLLPGDLIRSLDGIPTRSHGQLADLAFERAGGTEASLAVERYDRDAKRWLESTLVVRLGSMGDARPTATMRPGLVLEAIDRKKIEELKLEAFVRMNGVLVLGISSPSSAALAGFEEGDLILRLGTASLEGSEDVERKLRDAYASIAAAMAGKKPLAATVVRGGSKVEIKSFRP